MKVAVVLAVCLLQLNGVVQGANPNYSYHVKIDDPAHINFQEKAETRKGEDAQGFYSVLEPNGALRTVSYIADERGFNPVVSYSYGHPQSSVSVHSATGGISQVQKVGQYAPAYVTDNRVQITDKSNIYAVPPPAINVQAFALPGPSTPVVVPAPLRQATPVVQASAAIAANYAPAYVPPVRAYLPPPQPQVVAVAQPQPQVVVRQPQVVVRQPQVVVRQPQVVVRQPQVVAAPPPRAYLPPPQVLAVPQPQVVAVPQPQAVTVKQYHQEVIGLAPPPLQAFAVTKVRAQPTKVLTSAPAVKVIKSRPAVAVVQDSYSQPPRNTFRDPNAESYPDALPVRVSEPSADYGPPAYQPPPPITEAPPTKVVQTAKVIQTAKVVQPVVQQVALPPPPAITLQKYVTAPQPAVAVQAVAQQPTYVNNGLYAGAIGYHTHIAAPDSYAHSYGTQGFQVTSSRQYNKAIFAVPKQVVRAPTPVYAPPAIAVQKVVQPAPVYGPPQVAIQQPPPVYGPPPVRVVQPKPVYGPPPTKVIQQQVALPPPPQFVQTVQAPQVFAPSPPPPQAVAVAAPPPQAVAAPVAVSGKKQNPLTFAYSYDQGGAKVTHSYSGSGW